MSQYYLGLMSGTSLDAIDAAVVDFGDDKAVLAGFHTHPLPESLRETLLRLLQGRSPHPVQCLGELDHAFGEIFADASLALLDKTDLTAGDIQAIGSHGQTIYHQPGTEHPFSLQIGDPNLIAELTGITTVADFRRRDMAAGGQGAPLAPAFHAHAFAEQAPCAILNIGGMANLTLLRGDGGPVTGFDTGPGNVLLDAWAQRHLHTPFDRNGEWAQQANADEALLETLLADDYFQAPPPKSTGRERFNLAWLENRLAALDRHIEPRVVQASLTELTAHSVADALRRHAPHIDRVLVCGGGVHNRHLLSRLQARCPGIDIASTARAGIDPDALEAMAFAWLARQTLDAQPGNLPSVTGAAGPRILGGVFPGGRGGAALRNQPR